jgi:hypothetical protein
MRDDELATMARTCTALLREVVAEMTRRLSARRRGQDTQSNQSSRDS